MSLLWSRLLAGDSGVGPISLFDVSGYRVQLVPDRSHGMV